MYRQFVQGNPMFTSINKVPRQYPYLTENISTEIVIVGGGVTGAILGYYFTKHNIPCVILEKNRIAHCSTSATTALLEYELDDNLKELSSIISLEKLLRVYKLGISALNEIDIFIKENGNKCNYIKKDALLYTSRNLEKKELYEEYNLRKENGFNVEFIDEYNNPFSFDLKAGIYSKDGGIQLDPYKFTHELLEVGCNNGLKVYENTEVIDVNYMNDGVEVETIYGYKVKGKIIVVATGYNTTLFTKRKLGTKYTTFSIGTKVIRSFDGWFNRALIRDNSNPYNYLRTTWDNRIIIGGEDINFSDNIINADIANKKYDILEQRLKSMFNNIKDIEIQYRYCGTFISTKDNLGFVGPEPTNNKLWYCLGYGANGILFTILGAMMLTEFYYGIKNRDLDLFKIDRFDS
ncbi:NAD(P)/FAD-dependent oxidoreductase [Clostridium botulinum]|uniref:NAD(P)/FAD-dependent oxidoreductase n=1 Tax=Clostridium botulinum TaxID=1491 RepID=UPI0006A489EC|nr:FAD-dependent oxidoreductase [Clostridium botulinum]KOC36176.1 oxidoreductase [Clostridium botulinum]